MLEGVLYYMDKPDASRDGQKQGDQSSQDLVHLSDIQVINILERITDGFVAIDHDWRYIYVNHQAEQLTGIKREDLLGKRVWDVYPEAVGTLFYQKYHEAMRTQQSLSFEDYYPPGQRWYTLHLYPSPEGLSIIYSDITERKRAEQQLLFHANVVQSISDAVIATDTQYTILSWNKAAETLYGWTQEEVLGKAASDILWYEFPYNPPDEWKEHLQTRGYWKGQVIHKRKDGTQARVMASVSQVKDSNGTIIGAVAANRDITEWKELERSKDEFIGAASHELRTPVTALKGYTQLLQRTLEKQGLRDHAQTLAKMDGQLNRLTKLIADLLDVSKMQMGKIAYSKAVFDFNAWVHDIINDIQQASPHHVIALTRDTQCKIIGDQDRLSQVFINLLTNAIKYSPKAERVDVIIRPVSDIVTVSVRDYGIGIPKEHHSRIFERFYRVASSHDNTFPGLGIGLYISHEIIQAHEGKIWVESEEGKGSTFFVSLPLAQDE
jgi:PAS domain S-box-containing protein